MKVLQIYSQHIKYYYEKASWKTAEGWKAIGVTKTKKLLLYTPTLKLYVKNRVYIIHNFLSFTEEICNGGCHDDYNTSKKQVGD